jgi:release factor glutamine methyltransferase
LADVRAVVAGAIEWLRPGGWLVVEIGAGQRSAVSELMAAAGFAEVVVHRDHADLDRIAVGRRIA